MLSQDQLTPALIGQTVIFNQGQRSQRTGLVTDVIGNVIVVKWAYSEDYQNIEFSALQPVGDYTMDVVTEP